MIRWIAVGAVSLAVACTREQPTACSEPLEVRVTYEPGFRWTPDPPPVPTLAVGGSYALRPMCVPAHGCDGNTCIMIPLDIPYLAEAIEGDAVRVTATDSSDSIALEGVHPGTNSLRISTLGGETLVTTPLAALQVERFELAPFYTDDQIPLGATLAFAIASDRQHQASVRAFGANGTSLVDRRATSPIDYSSYAPGSYPVAVSSGDATGTVELIVTDHVDSIAPSDSAQKLPAPGAGPSAVLFSAMLGSSFVTGLEWQYRLDGVPQQGANWVYVGASDDVDQNGSVAIEAAAGGQATTLVLGK